TGASCRGGACRWYPVWCPPSLHCQGEACRPRPGRSGTFVRRTHFARASRKHNNLTSVHFTTYGSPTRELGEGNEPPFLGRGLGRNVRTRSSGSCDPFPEQDYRRAQNGKPPLESRAEKQNGIQRLGESTDMLFAGSRT